jgi:hypothetical protein
VTATLLSSLSFSLLISIHPLRKSANFLNPRDPILQEKAPGPDEEEDKEEPAAPAKKADEAAAPEYDSTAQVDTLAVETVLESVEVEEVHPTPSPCLRCIQCDNKGCDCCGPVGLVEVIWFEVEVKYMGLDDSAEWC